MLDLKGNEVVVVGLTGVANTVPKGPELKTTGVFDGHSGAENTVEVGRIGGRRNLHLVLELDFRLPTERNVRREWHLKPLLEGLGRDREQRGVVPVEVHGEVEAARRLPRGRRIWRRRRRNPLHTRGIRRRLGQVIMNLRLHLAHLRKSKTTSCLIGKPIGKDVEQEDIKKHTRFSSGPALYR